MLIHCPLTAIKIMLLFLEHIPLVIFLKASHVQENLCKQQKIMFFNINCYNLKIEHLHPILG